MAQVWIGLRHPALVHKCIFSFYTAGLNYFPKVIQLITLRPRNRIQLSRFSLHIWNQRTGLLLPETPSSLKKKKSCKSMKFWALLQRICETLLLLAWYKTRVVLICKNTINYFLVYLWFKSLKYQNWFDSSPPFSEVLSHYSGELKKKKNELQIWESSVHRA